MLFSKAFVVVCSSVFSLSFCLACNNVYIYIFFFFVCLFVFFVFVCCCCVVVVVLLDFDSVKCGTSIIAFTTSESKLVLLKF